MIKIKNPEVLDKLVNDIGFKIRDEMRDEIIAHKDYYVKPYADKLDYYPEDKAIKTSDFGIAVLNAGRVAGAWPNIDAIREWVKYTKDNGANREKSDEEIAEIAYLVSKKIKDEGIEPTWFVDRILREVEG